MGIIHDTQICCAFCPMDAIIGNYFVHIRYTDEDILDRILKHKES